MAEAAKTYTAADIERQIKPLSRNAFVRFFQKLYRQWLGVWYGFCDRAPKLSAVIYKVFFFLVFSVGVTIWQFIVMAIVPEFLPKTEAVGWPMIPIAAAGGRSFIIFGDEQGWATFICFEVAVFTAQCINFPLQRNVTYRSHGNPYFQALWYFIGWALVSVATNAVWGVCNVFLLHWGVPDVVNGLIKTFLTGLVSMVIFFFIFLVIFPDNDKLAKKSRARYQRLKAGNAPAEAIAKAEAKCRLWEERAAKSAAESALAKAKSQLNSKAMKYVAAVKAQGNAKTEEEKRQCAARAEKCFAEAVEAIAVKNAREAEYEAVTANPS